MANPISVNLFRSRLFHSTIPASEFGESNPFSDSGQRIVMLFKSFVLSLNGVWSRVRSGKLIVKSIVYGRG